MGHAEDIRSMLTMKEVAQAYGVRVDRNGFARCPFHHERTGSFKIFNDGGFKCFGCGASGDIFSFVQRLYGLSFRETMAKLNEDFHLGLPIGQRQSPRQRLAQAQEAHRRRKEKAAAEMALEAAKSDHDKALNRWVIFDTFVRKNAPKSELEAFDDKWVAALHCIGLAEWQLEQAEIKLYDTEHSIYKTVQKGYH